MARAGTRSQRQPSQSQARQPKGSQSQSQRTRRGRVDEEEEEAEVDDQGEREENDANDEDDGMDGGDAQKELERKANDLVRLALFTESRRVPLRREEISKKVLGSSTRSFNLVLARAQDILEKTFGMELVELQSRAGLEKDAANDKDADLMKNTGVKKRAAPSGTKTYILRSLLDPKIIERACLPDPDISRLEQEELVNDDDYDNEDAGVGAHSIGSILAWHQCDELGSVGLLYVILAMILVDGRVMRDNDLRAILKRLRLPSGAAIPLSSRPTQQSLTVDTYLTQLVRQGYLDRQRVGEAKGGKRGRAPAATQAGAGDDGANVFEWRWGSRAMSEVGETAIAKFVAEFMVERPGEEDDEEDAEAADRRVEDAAKKKQFDAIMKGIERAAAGIALQDLK